MGKSQPHERHLFPPNDSDDHIMSQWCRCHPHRRERKQRKSGRVSITGVYWVHNVLVPPDDEPPPRVAEPSR